MHIESFHRLLKVVYLESKQNRRLISIIIKISKLLKGKHSHRTCQMHKRHRDSMEMFRSGCEPVPTKCKLFITSRSLVCGEQVGTFAESLAMHVKYVYRCIHAHVWTMHYTTQHVITYNLSTPLLIDWIARNGMLIDSLMSLQLKQFRSH